jgi:hypothetical protein
MVALAGGVFMTSRYTGGIAAAGLMAAVAAGGSFGTGLAVLVAAAACSTLTARGLRGRPAVGEPVASADGVRPPREAAAG